MNRIFPIRIWGGPVREQLWKGSWMKADFRGCFVDWKPLFWVLSEGEGAEVTFVIMFRCPCWEVVPSFLFSAVNFGALVYESVEVGCLPFHLLLVGFELILER